MDDKNLSGEEKRKALKEQFKKDLKLRKEFQNKVRALKKQKRITDAVQGLLHEDDTDDLISQLNESSAFMEAKTELAMGDTLDTAKDINKNAETDEEMKKIVAESLVEKMKAEMQEEQKMEDLKDVKKKDLLSEEEEEDDPDDDSSKKKTLGDFDL